VVLYVLAVLAAAMLFGTTGTAQALGPEGTTPLSIGVMRMVIGGTGLAVLAFLLARRHARRQPATSLTLRALSRAKGDIRPLSLMVLTGACLAIYQPLFFLGTERNGVAVGTVVANSLSQRALEVLFALFILVVAYRMVVTALDDGRGSEIELD
jgi:DME family drug/metabolite transporter